MDNSASGLLKKLTQYESEISSILGMLVVAALAVFIFLFVKKFMPKPSISPLAETTLNTENLMKQDAAKTYMVKPGQGLAQIAKEVLGDGNKWVQLAEANGLKAPYILKAGQELKLPSGVTTTSTTVAATPTVAASVAKVEKLVAQDNAQKAAETNATTETKTPSSDNYVVTRGDSLWNIAVAQYGSGYAWTRIYQANKAAIGKNPGIIHVGSSLVMPK